MIEHTGCIGDGCPLCPLLERPGYERALALLTGQPLPPLRDRSCQCINLGEATGETVPCEPCQDPGRKLKVHACDVHGRCSLAATQAGLKGCQDCPDHAADFGDAPEAGGVRHLLFHVYPLRGSDSIWRGHARDITQRLHLFNGRKILAIAYDRNTADVTAVRFAFQRFDEYIEVPNVPHLREVATFEPLFSRVADLTGPEHVTLYAHGKGVTFQRHGHPTIPAWNASLYETMIDYWPVAQSVLQKFPVAGSYKKIGRGWPDHESKSTWHYSGSWFWFRNRDLFRKDWRRIDKFWSGVEPYPSLHFPVDRAGCVFFEALVPQLQFYGDGGPAFLRDTVAPALAKWREQHASERMPRIVLPPKHNGPLLKVEIGGGVNPLGGDWINVDYLQIPGVDAVVDFERLGSNGVQLPFADESVDAVYSAHCLEHVANVIGLLRDIARACKVGAQVEIRVPDWLGEHAYVPGHLHSIPPIFIHSVTVNPTTSPEWWRQCARRLRWDRTENIKAEGTFEEIQAAFPTLTEDQIIRFIPGALHERRYFFTVVPNE